MTAAEIARALGAAHRSGRWWRCRCPVHGSKGPTLAVRDGDRAALVVHCHAGCSWAEIFKELRRLGLLDGTFANAKPPAPAADLLVSQAALRTAAALKLWNAAKLAERAVLLERYLRSRNITMPIPRSLRWARSIRHPTGVYCSAMIARIDDVDGKLISVHRTFLRADGLGKAALEPPRAALGPVKGGAIRLAPAGPTLLIGEGIENCLSATQATGLPAWSAISASFMEALQLPEVVRVVVILADNDRNGAGQRSAARAGQRWIEEGRRVRIALPPETGSDFNDILTGRSGAEDRHGQ
jgi:hypothetical protein